MNDIVRGIIHRRTNRKGLIDSRQISVLRDDGFLPDELHIFSRYYG